MKQDLKNSITRAVNSGIGLGFDLCDIDVEDNTTILKDIKQTTSTFQKKSLKTIINFTVEQYLENNECEKEKEIIKTLCCNYEDEYYACYLCEDDIVKLRELIKKLCQDFGPRINLNWIDVRQMTRFNYKDGDYTIGLFMGLNFTGDISQWNVSNVTSISNLFVDCNFNGDISQWDVSHCKDMFWVFYRSLFNGDISHWDVSSVNSMHGMFHDSNFNQDLSQWDVSHVCDMGDMFSYSKFDRDISMWDIRNVYYIKDIFLNSKIRDEYKPNFKNTW